MLFQLSELGLALKAYSDIEIVSLTLTRVQAVFCSLTAQIGIYCPYPFQLEKNGKYGNIIESLPCQYNESGTYMFFPLDVTTLFDTDLLIVKLLLDANVTL